MKKILILGEGRIAQPLVNYLPDNSFDLTIASTTLFRAQEIMNGRKNGTAVEWSTEDPEMLDTMVSTHDLTISLLPNEHQVEVASCCIKNKKNLIATSSLSQKMKNLDVKAKKAGVLLLNEVGISSGLDHMTAKRIIDKIHKAGSKIKEFYSISGALPAPEEADNPFGYKFYRSPREVLKESNNGAKFLKNHEIVEISPENLFENPGKITFGGIGQMEIYPNRNALQYSELYSLQEAQTVFKGILRYPNWCKSMDAIKKLGMTSLEKQNFKERSYKEVVGEQIGVYPKNVKEKVAERLNIELDDPAIISMEWLGFFDNDRIKIEEGSPFDLTTDLMMQKMMLPPDASDMVVMLHSLLIEKSNGKKEVIRSQMHETATKGNSSIARTIALPAAIAGMLILNGRINNTGVQIPVSSNIYEPVLNELEKQGIYMREEWGLPETEILH